MVRMFINVTGLITVLAIAAGMATGEVAAHNAFFLAVATVMIIGGQEFASRANQHFLRATRAIFVEPKSYGSSARYGLFVATILAGVLLSAGAAIAAG